ncbi:MAG: hypothetical protein GX174_09990 [Lentisphaerae bacterium]|jgi:hypothetical protein|nr:hypothetical protein [Lentisphaerota bacterium]
MKGVRRFGAIGYALIGFILLALLALQFHRQSVARQNDIRNRQRLLASLAPDLERLQRYEDVERAIRDALHRDAAPPTLPAHLPAPAGRETKRLPPAGGWRGLQLEMTWPRIETPKALEVAVFCATNPPAWRLGRLQIEALENAGHCRLQLTLERVEEQQ